jgi:hypothetical protein
MRKRQRRQCAPVCCSPSSSKRLSLLNWLRIQLLVAPIPTYTIGVIIKTKRRYTGIGHNHVRAFAFGPLFGSLKNTRTFNPLSSTAIQASMCNLYFDTNLSQLVRAIAQQQNAVKWGIPSQLMLRIHSDAPEQDERPIPDGENPQKLHQNVSLQFPVQSSTSLRIWLYRPNGEWKTFETKKGANQIQRCLVWLRSNLRLGIAWKLSQRQALQWNCSKFANKIENDCMLWGRKHGVLPTIPALSGDSATKKLRSLGSTPASGHSAAQEAFKQQHHLVN